MRLKIYYVTLILVFPVILFSNIVIKSDDYAIFINKDSGSIAQYSAKELQKHLNLILKKEPKILSAKNDTAPYAYIFYVGIKDPGDKDSLKEEECRYTIYKNKTYIYGSDSKNLKNIDEVLLISKYLTGTLYGVYMFLNKELGVDWISPENSGIVYPDLNHLELNEKKFTWHPPIAMRDMWQRAYSIRTIQNGFTLPDSFKYIDKDYIIERNKEESVFFRRMKLGRRRTIRSAHSYRDYWYKFKDTHPNWFALNKFGKREPLGNPEYVKMCLTAEGLVEHVVEKWHKKWLANHKNLLILASPNDGETGFCRCDKCKALDVNTDDEIKLDFDLRSKSDRYVWYWNQIAKKAQKYTPDALVSVYLYSSYRYAPHQRKLSDGVLGGFVPRFYDNPELVKSTLDGWFKMGLKNFYLRPNDFNDDIGLPTGNEKYIYDRFHNSYIVSKKYDAKMLAVSYDRVYSYNDYEVNGLAFYTIVNSINDPERSFEEIVDRYYSAYGPAREKIRKFFEYWRNEVFYKRRYPDRTIAIGFEGRGTLYSNAAKYYKAEDFQITRQYLLDALQIDNLRDQERQRINKLLWDLECKYAEFKALCAAANLEGDTDNLKTAVNELLNLRYKYRDKIFSAWHRAFKFEDDFGDAAGYKRSKVYGDLILYPLPNKLRFKIDRNNIGISEKWYSHSYNYYNGNWPDFINITTNWETGKGDLRPELRDELKNYDGYAWYYLEINKNLIKAHKKHYLIFGAVDESCWVYVNGKFAGKHIFKKPNDWMSTFKIRIDQFFNAGKNQNIVIRVFDKKLNGGIWKKISLGIEK